MHSAEQPIPSAAPRARRFAGNSDAQPEVSAELAQEVSRWDLALPEPVDRVPTRRAILENGVRFDLD